MSSAPHIARASDHTASTILYARADPLVEVGIQHRATGSTPLAFPTDELWFCLRGRATFGSDAIAAGDVIHFNRGWSGLAKVQEAFVASYMRGSSKSSDGTTVLRDALTAGPLADLGTVSTMIEGTSHMTGIDVGVDSGVWTCTPGIWRCGVSRNEYCHFIAGRSTYYHESGEVIEIAPDTLACFPAGWNGVCEVRETVRKVYMKR
jgi:uncharacterized protein